MQFAATEYIVKELGSSTTNSMKYKITDAYPFNENSRYKNTCAMAYVNTYKTFWRIIAELRQELNTNFTRDYVMMKQLQDAELKLSAQQRYQYSNDSLKAKYGELTKMIASQTATPDIHSEMRFYEDAQKLVFMGKTIDFKDIVSCEIIDDPQFVPGKTTTYGGGLCFFGFLVGGKETRTTASKTIHNYVVDVEIDNMRTPFIRIATGDDEFKAKEISSVFEYIMRHQQSPKATGTQKSRVTRRTKR